MLDLVAAPEIARGAYEYRVLGLFASKSSGWRPKSGRGVKGPVPFDT